MLFVMHLVLSRCAQVIDGQSALKTSSAVFGLPMQGICAEFETGHENSS
jgi:hypothetical protein